MLRAEIHSFNSSGFQEETKEQGAEIPDWQELIAKYEQEIANEPLETVRFAEGHMGIISSPNHFGQAVVDAELIEKMVAFESERLGLDPDLSLLSQLGEDDFVLLDASLNITSIINNSTLDQGEDITKELVTLRQAFKAVVTEAAELARIHKRWVSIEQDKKSKPEVIAKSIAIGVKLVREYVEQFVEEPEAIILTSSFLPNDMARLVIDQALLEGVLTKKPKYYEIRLYCAGTVAALEVILSNPVFSEMSNVAILALEPISALIEDRHYSIEDNRFQSAVIFSDDFLIMRVQPSEFYLRPESILRAIDDRGVIKLDSWSEFPSGENPPQRADWLQRLLGENNQDILFIDETHMIIQMRSPEEDQPRAEMNPKATAKFFSFHSVLIILEILKQVEIKHVHNHEPSGGVIVITDHGVTKKISRNPELILQTPESVPKLIFLGVGNSSSGTFLRQLFELAKRGLLSDQAFRETTLGYAPGAGATFAAAVIEARKTAQTEEVTIFSAPDND
ncbi:MAG TPA: hypothetical protein PKJ26_03400 [Candidatus Woesebacteria bacterium]|nr:hypothetical protein [Candidatus Woesebacteria bacterium]HNS65516.1 hypothetical protein [Candidatus Woesebacteria bacterium]